MPPWVPNYLPLLESARDFATDALRAIRDRVTALMQPPTLLFKCTGWLFLLAAVISLAVDGTNATLGSGSMFISLWQHWTNVAPGIMAASRKAISTSLHPLVWDPGIKTLLTPPGWLSFGLLAALLLYAGRRRKRIEVFIN